MNTIQLDTFSIGGGSPLVLIAGPCVIETMERTREIALILKDITQKLDIPLIFKASYDKANRTSKDSYRGPGIEKGLRILETIHLEIDVPILSDVHRYEEISTAARVLDILQVPAFLCRQTDFIMEVARTGRIVNIKKGQFMAPWDMEQVIAKATMTGNRNIMITERGACFGYNNLIADMRALPIMRRLGYPVIFDATHSVQLPGGEGFSSGGDRDMAMHLGHAATAVGIDGLFVEVHPDPDMALCDGPNSIRIDVLPEFLQRIKEIDSIAKRGDR